jgi:hypothetical protein
MTLVDIRLVASFSCWIGGSENGLVEQVLEMMDDANTEGEAEMNAV